MALSQEWIFKKEFLEDVNSARFNHTTDVKKEKENRFKTIWFMKDLSNILRPGPTKDGHKDRKEEEAEFDIRNLKVFWTACTFFHRFYVFHSFDSHARFAVAVACLFLASKVEEKPLRLSDHIFLYFRLRKNKILKKADQEFKDMERDVLLAERILLQTLSFDLNVVHPYQFFRQTIGKDLRSWFPEADDSKQVLRLATTLLSDSFRTTLCLQYSANQMNLALVFLALCISGLKPSPPPSASSGYSRGSIVNNISSGSSDTTWLDIIERDIDEQVLQNICMTLVDMYENSSFPPTEVPFSSSTKLREGINAQLSSLADKRAAQSKDQAAARGGIGNITPPTLDLGSEEFKGGSPEDELASNKRKQQQLSPLHGSGSGTHRAVGSDGFAGPVGSSSKYKSLPPPFMPLPMSGTGSSSPCYDAPTPRSSYRPARTVMDTHLDASLLTSGIQSPEVLPPPPDSPMDSAYSTFSQMHAAQQSKGGLGAAAGEDTPAGSVTDTPTYMPPPPDTPGSMASTPNFDNLPKPGMHHQLTENMFQNKKPRTDY